MDAKLELFQQALALKDETRTGWVLREIVNPESVADHSWGTAFLCLLYAEEAGVDAGRAVHMAVVHDLAECITGDIARRVDASIQAVSESDKADQERDAMDRLTGALEDRQVRELWEEYENRRSPEALFVRDMNLIDMCSQALAYETERRYAPTDPHPNFPGFSRLDEFFATSGPRISTQVGKRLFEELDCDYRRVRDHTISR